MTTPTLSDIESCFEPKTFQRAQDVYRQGKVRSVTLKQQTDQRLMLEAITQGSHNERYQQRITLYKFTDHASWGLESFCTCPMSHDCKHCAAALIKWIVNAQSPYQATNADQQQQERAYQRWLESLAAQQNQYLPEASSQHPFRYHLFENATAPHNQVGSAHSDLEIFSQIITPTGLVRKPKKLPLSRFFDDLKYSDQKLSPLSKQVGKLLHNCLVNAWSQNQVSLVGREGYLALKAVIQSGRGFFKDQETPLHWHDQVLELPLVFQAQTHAKPPLLGRLSLDLDPALFLVFCEPPVAINPQTQTVHPLKTALSSKTLWHLHNMPLATQAQLAQLMDLLELEQTHLVKEKRKKPQSLPKIPGLEALEITADPKPVLRLTIYDNEPLFQLDFYYAPYVCPFYPRLALIKSKAEGKKITLHRQFSLEDGAIDWLKNHLKCTDEHDLALASDDPDNIGPMSWQLPSLSLNTQEGLAEFLAFQEQLPALQSQGWILEGFENNTFDVVAVDDISVQSDNHNDWFELRFDMKLGDKTVSLEPIIQQLLQNPERLENLPETLQILTDNQQVLRFNTAQISPIIEVLLQLFKTHKLHNGSLKVNAFDTHLIAGLGDAPIQWLGSRDTLQLAEKLRSFKGIEAITPPLGLQAELRPYQQFGLNWLCFLHQYRFNGILADDMGLGKTLQTLSYLLKLKETQQLKHPALLVVPTSLIGNWKSEAQRFAPDLNLLTLHGSERFSEFEKIPQADIVLTTYPLIARDIERLQDIQFSLLILDEAQKIKNPTTKLYASLQNLNSQRRLALTGTPVENNLGELWALFNFLMPGFLSNLKTFKNHYQKPIEIERDRTVQALLNQKVAPFLLRRTKHQVVSELPDKTEIIHKVEFDKEQAQLYESIRLTMSEKVREAVAQNGLAKSQITLLDALLKLRQVCCDPGLVKLPAAQKVKHSAKLELLLDLVEELLEGQHRILIFSQFTSMLKIIEDRLTKANIGYALLTGQTKKREEAIERFRSGDVAVFLISLKAGGVGLNLTEADSVIHYDPWWNPAVENQATDRAHRIGQNKEVFVYKLVVANTIEEKILALQARKQSLQDQLYAGQKDNPESQANLSGEDLMALLQL